MATSTTGLPAVDPRIKTLFINNLARSIEDGERPDSYDIPAALRTHGYTGAAEIMEVADHTVRHYWQADLKEGRSQAMPPPDVIITRIIQRADGTKDFEVLPGWTEQTIREWMPVRVGTGNHTRGENRRGNDNGRAGWSKKRGTDPARVAAKASAAALLAGERAAAAKAAAKAAAAKAVQARAEAAKAKAAAMNPAQA